MSYIDPSGKIFRVADLDIKSNYCPNTLILFKDNLNDYRIIFHLCKDDEYVVLSKNTDNIGLSLKINDSDSIENAISVYDYNLGCIIFNTSKDMFNLIANEDTSYTCTILITVDDNDKQIHTSHKIPITVLPGDEYTFYENADSPNSKVNSYYVTGGKHSKSTNPKFSDLINY